MCRASISACIIQILLSLTRTHPGSASICLNRAPNGTLEKVPGDNGFYLEISGDVTKYEASASYTIKLAGRVDLVQKKKFTNFLLISENTEPSLQTNPRRAGNFQLLGDVLTRYSDHCTNTIAETSPVPKHEIQVLWTAPPPGSGCINFKAMVVENSSVWALDNGRLTLKVCEEKEEEEEANVILDECCACSEAKYEVVFQGLWSKETHPKDFPLSEWLLHFSDVIGASHSKEYRVWEAGGLASKGIAQVAKWGSPRLLESELKAKSSYIRTIIKSRGLWYPNVNGKTFSIFRADPRNHLVSLVSMLGPSPDWIVGVSAMELCLQNCTWAKEKDLYLYPWDAGVDSGMSYESPDLPTSPQEPIRRITSSYPNNPPAPFFKERGGPIQPLARLTIQKLREYKKSCSAKPNTSSQQPNSDGFSQDLDLEPAKSAGCEVTGWSSWSGCSVTCGKGLTSRRREYFDVDRSREGGCNEQLVQKEMCAAEVGACDGEGGFYQSAPVDFIPDDMCGTTEWSGWSECSATCGVGFRVRTRRFYNRMGRKQCPHVETVMKEECAGSKEICTPGQTEEIDPACAVTDWSLWSPCSVSCGSGIKVRTRLYRVTREEQLRAGCTVQLMEKGTCTGKTEDCGWVAADDICGQKVEAGPCRGVFSRWYHDSSDRVCKQFTFGGCRGNSNNFLKIEDCVKLCANFKSTGTVEDPRPQPKNTSTTSPLTSPLDYSTNLLADKNFILSLDLLATERREQQSEGMNEIFKEIEEQRQVVTELEREEKSLGVFFNKRSQLMVAQKKLMMMEKQVMMKKQMEVFQQKQKMMEMKSNIEDDPYNREFSDPPAAPSSLVGEIPNQQPTTFNKVSNQEPATSSRLSNQKLSTPFRLSNQQSSFSTKPKLSVNSSKPIVQDCELTAWSPWSLQCTSTCGRGFRHRFRTVSRPAVGGGQPCSQKLEKRKKCRLPVCAEECVWESWSPWGPCTHTCGTLGSQNRFRQVLSGYSCDPEEERKVCLLACCPGDQYC